MGFKTECRHRGMKLGIAPHFPDYWGRQLAAGGGMGFKTERRHRGMKLGIAPYSPDYWGRQLAAGGDEENRTPVRKPLDITFFVGSLLFKFPLGKREQTRYFRK